MKKQFIFILLLAAASQLAAQAQLTNSGNLKLHTGAQMTVFGNFANNGTLVDSATTVTFAGTAAQSVSGSSATAFRNLVVSNTNGVTLQRAVDVTSTLTLTAGGLNLNSNTLTINNPAGSAIVRTAGYIVSEQTGNLSKLTWAIGSNTSAHVFPFGTASGSYIPFTLTQTAGTIGNVTVSTYPTAANNTPYPSAPNVVTNVNDMYNNDNSSNTVDRFWQIDKTGLTGTATLIFTATTAEIGTITSLRAQRWNTSLNGWDQPLAGQSSTATTVTVPGVTSFSPWALSGNSSALPIQLLEFTAVPVNNSYVDLDWETAVEINNDFFTIERTIDGVNFETVAIVDGAGTTTQNLEYETRDGHPHAGITYYRLKQTDFNGHCSYSAFVPVEIKTMESFAMNVFPNPSSGPVNVSVTGAADEVLQLSLVDAQGSRVYTKQLIAGSGNATFTIEPEQTLAPGIYTLTVSGATTYSSQRLIVQ